MMRLRHMVVLAVVPLTAFPASAEWSGETAATVNGAPILLREYQKELATSTDYWNKTNPGSLNDPANLRKVQESTLEQLINREVLYQEGVRQGLSVSEGELDQGISQVRSRFSSQAEFEAQLRADGLTYEQFRQRLSKQVMGRKLIDGKVRALVPTPSLQQVRLCSRE